MRVELQGDLLNWTWSHQAVDSAFADTLLEGMQADVRLVAVVRLRGASVVIVPSCAFGPCAWPSFVLPHQPILKPSDQATLRSCGPPPGLPAHVVACRRA